MVTLQEKAPLETTRQAADRVLEILSQKPQSISELADMLGKKPAIGRSKDQRIALAKEVAGTLLSKGRIYEHPVGGRNRSVRYGLTPPDPQKYVTKTSMAQLQTTYQKLLKAKVPPSAIVAAAATKLDPPFRLSSSGAASGAAWLEGVVDYLRKFNQQHPSENLPLPELYRAAAEPHGVSLGAFHDGLRQLWDQKRIRLVEWTQPLYTMRDDRFALIVDREIRYYARIA